jgi:hypothetical protein
MKKIPIMPPISDALSALFVHLLGSVISKYPKNEIAKITKTAKKVRFNHGLVDILFNTSGSTSESKWKGVLNRKYISMIKAP